MAFVVEDGNQTDITDGLTAAEGKVLSILHADIIWPDLQTSSNFSCRMSSSLSLLKYRWAVNSNRFLNFLFLFSTLLYVLVSKTL